MNPSQLLRGLPAAACGACCLVAAAAPVSYGFTGQVDYDDADRGYQGFVGNFSFDSAAANQINDPSGSTGSYTGVGAAWSMSLAFDGGTVLDFGSQGFHVNVTNDLGGYDGLGLLGTGSAGTVSVGLYDFTTTLFSDAGLPLRDGGYTLENFGWSDFRWDADGATLQGRFTSLKLEVSPTSPVPEPASGALAVLGLLLATAAARRRGSSGGSGGTP